MPYALKCGRCHRGAASLDVAVAAYDKRVAPMLRAIAAAAPVRVNPLRAFIYCKHPGGCDEDLKAVRGIDRLEKVEVTSLPNVLDLS